MKLKLCGIRDQAMLEFCSALPVDYIGLNFVSWSKRKITILPPLNLRGGGHKTGGVRLVGIFSDQSLEEVIQVTQDYQLDVIQLHGDEESDYIDRLVEMLGAGSLACEIWKALSIEEHFDSKILQRYSKNTDLFLFDGSVPGSGIQISYNHKLSESIQEAEKLNIPYGIAGGINTSNIAAFVEQFPNAELLDTASGLEADGAFSELETTQLVMNFQNEQ